MVVVSTLRSLRERVVVRTAAYAGVITVLVLVSEAGKKWS